MLLMNTQPHPMYAGSIRMFFGLILLMLSVGMIESENLLPALVVAAAGALSAWSGVTALKRNSGND